ncbi:MAG: beta-N-acetylhexosaminidase, partial [Candidatus Dormibacteraceae bacterium]
MAATESELREWAGQCLAVGLPGPSVDRASARMLAELRAGTVILFARNTPDVLTTRQLIDELQALAAKAHREPLLVCADQEGGRVQRLREGATDLPAAMLLGQAGPDHVRAVSAMAADELLAAGITFVLAPVCDVNVEPANPIIGNRAFGADAELVGACVAAAIEGYRSAGLLTCAKHFPGHGDTRVDSHLGLPALERTPAQLEEVELPPFRSAVAAGVDSVMVGHLAVPALDPSGTPASLSPPLLGGLLRERLGWQGLVCADDLEMAGVAGQDTTAGELAVRAMAAGCDLLFFSHTPSKAVAAAAALVEAVSSGRLSEARLREAAERVRALRERLRVGSPPALADVGSAPHAAIV